MKLFIWSNPYHVAYGSSMILAVAENEVQARELAKHAKCYAFNEYDNGKASQNVVGDLGTPTRVIEVPCAEWHEWSE